MSEIRVVTDEEFPELFRIVMEAYPGEGMDTGKSIEQHLERFKKTRRDTSWEPWGVFRDGKLVGVYRNFDFSMNVRGNLLAAGGLGMVAVDLTQKKKHVAKDIVEAFLKHYDDKGCAMTTLWPFRVDFYHNMGFGLGAPRHRYRITPTSLPRGTTKEHVRFLSADDVPALGDCYNRCVEKQNGMIRHNEGRWQNRFEFARKLKYVGCEIDGRIDGYLAFSFKPPDHAGSFMDNDVVVSELFYHTPEALSELLTFLHSQLDQVGRIHLETSEDEIYFLMSDPTIGSGGKLTPTFHESHMTGVGIMYRVMDVKRLFEKLTLPSFGDDKLTVKITLTDSFFPSNNGSTVVRFEGGLGTVHDKATEGVEISLDVSEFSSLVMGSARFRSLHTYGLARISDETYLDRIDSLFAYHQKPVTISGF